MMQIPIQEYTDSEDDLEISGPPKVSSEGLQPTSLSIPRPPVSTAVDKVDPLEDILDDLLDA
jgi:hypothetical protein